MPYRNKQAPTMRERVIDNATKTAKRHANAGVQKSPRDTARHYGVHASIYIKTYDKVYRRAIKKINKELAKINASEDRGLETPIMVPPNSTEAVSSSNASDDMLQTLCDSLLSYVGTNDTQAIEMVLDSGVNSEDSFVSYLQDEFPVPQLFASVAHFRFEEQPTQFLRLTDESLSEGRAPPVKRSRLM